MSGDGAGGGAFAAADDLLAVGLANDFWGAIAGGGVRVDRVRVLFDDLASFWIDQSAIAVLDGNCNGVAAGGALAVLGGLGLGCFEPAGAVAAVEREASSAGAGGAKGGCGVGNADVQPRSGKGGGRAGCHWDGAGNC